MFTSFFASLRGSGRFYAMLASLALCVGASGDTGGGAAVMTVMQSVQQEAALADDQLEAKLSPAAAPSADTSKREPAVVPAAATAAVQTKPAAVDIVKVVATGYTAGFESTGKKPGQHGYGITYSGVKVRRDHVSTIAADPKVFPIGTLMYIPDYGYGVVADTGSKIKGQKIDLYFETTTQVYKLWGKRNVEVEIIKKGSGKLDEQWLEKINDAVAAQKTIPVQLIKS